MILTSYTKIKAFGDCTFYFNFYNKNEKIKQPQKALFLIYMVSKS